MRAGQDNRVTVRVWEEYYCPWCYITSVRLHAIVPDYRERIALKPMAFPLELVNRQPPPREELEHEWWLAALQEPRARFRRFDGAFPTTTLPAFDAAKAAERQGEDRAWAYDLRIREAFFAESADIGNPDVLLGLARDVGLDIARMRGDLATGAPREEVLAELRLGQETYGVRGTPTLVLPDGTQPTLPIAEPEMHDGKVVGVAAMPCCGDGCLDAMRRLLDRAICLS